MENMPPSTGTATRLLRLLPLFTVRRSWPAAELADRLGVTTRTVRRDIERLRDLGYPVSATPGLHGGYTFSPGSGDKDRGLPPLLLDDDSAVAVTIGLRTVAADPALAEAAARAAAAIEQVLPARLRRRVEALTAATVSLPATPISHNVLAFLAQACTSAEHLRFTYRDSSGNESRRHVQPYRLVATGRRWYLVARDIGKGEWRTFRVDRIAEQAGTGVRSSPADPPDAARFVTEGITSGPYRWRARVLLDAPAEVVADQVPATVAIVEAVDEQHCLLTTGSDSLAAIAMHLAELDIPFTPLEPPELRETCAALAARLYAALLSPRVMKLSRTDLRGLRPHARPALHSKPEPAGSGLAHSVVHRLRPQKHPSSTG
jgi:predicted DNA-binding transcriptional regulator YafY